MRRRHRPAHSTRRLLLSKRGTINSQLNDQQKTYSGQFLEANNRLQRVLDAVAQSQVDAALQ
jgi:hypothetical protein